MQIGSLSIDPSILAPIAIGIAGWLLSTFWAQPKARGAFSRAYGSDVPKTAGTLLVAQAASFAFGTLALVPSFIAIVYVVGQVVISRFGGEPDHIDALLRTRDLIERLSGPLTDIALWSWIATVIVLGLIWLIAARSTSVRRWRKALAVRRAAHAAAAASLSLDELLAEAARVDAAGAERVRQLAEQRNTTNLEAITEVEAMPVLTLTDGEGQEHAVSIAQLSALVESLERNAAALEAEGIASEENLEEAARANAMRAKVVNWRERLDTLSAQMSVSLLSADGSTRTFSLRNARSAPKITEADCRPQYQELLVSARTAEHNAFALRQDRAEPETFREWLGAVASGRLMVAATSAVGVLASRAAQVGFVAGLVGLSVVASDVGALIARAQSLELTLIAIADDAAFEQAVAAAPQPTPAEQPAEECVAEPDGCPDDAVVVERLRQAFRSLAAEALQQIVAERSGEQAASVRRQAYELGAVDARREALAGSARDAAPPADPALDRERIVLAANDSVDTHGPAGSGLSAPAATGHDPLDEAFDRQVERLRRNESTWRRARILASKPAPADTVAEAWLHAAFGQTGASELQASRIWAEQMASIYAREIAAGVDPTLMRSAVIRKAPQFGGDATTRDRRLVGDFMVDLPERVETRLAALHAGFEDPGSLTRAASPAGASTAPRGKHDVYAEYFPARVEPDEFPNFPSPGGGGGGGGGAGGGGARESHVQGRSGTARGAIARSYTRIRFSGRVGGVVFGRSPDEGGTSPDVVALTWSRTEDGVRLLVRRRDGTEIVLGPYRASIVHHALAFAADGRTVVTTLPFAANPPNAIVPIIARRVVVHPAFEDTAFGCSAIQVDRFVDTFTSASPGELGHRDRVSVVRTAVTALSRLIALEHEPDAPQEVRRSLVEAVLLHAKTCTAGTAQCFPIEHYRAMGLKLARAAAMIDCAAHTSNVEAFDGCMSNKPEPDPVGFWVDSGVREQPYRIDPELDFVTGKRAAADPLWPLIFMIQAVPQSATGEDLGDAELSGDPWEFPTIADDVSAIVRAGIDSDTNSAAIFSSIRDFVALQRFFRAAFEGSIGVDFPLAVLPDLSRATRADVRIERTEKWNVNEFFYQLDEEIGTFMEQMLSQDNVTSACRAAIEHVLSDAKRAPWPMGPGVWPFLANLEATCPRAELYGGPMATLYDVRDELRGNLVLDEMIATPSRRAHGEACPAP